MCKRRIVDLFPKLEAAVGNIKSAEAAVMQMQMKRQKEFWHLLKIVCVRVTNFNKKLLFFLQYGINVVKLHILLLILCVFFVDLGSEQFS